MASEIEKEIDYSKLKDLEDKISNLINKHVVVGVPASNNNRENGVSNAVIAATHEYGSPDQGIPERSFFRGSFLKNGKKYISLSASNFEKVLKGEMDADKALNILGAIAVGDVKAYIRDAEFTPLKQETIDRKGSSKPLIDTGAMSQSITYEVRGND